MKRPTESVVTDLSKHFNNLKQQNIYDTLPKNMANGFINMSQYLESKIKKDDELLIDYTVLLRAYRPDKPPKPPYESVYRGDEQVFSELTAKVQEYYMKAGLGVIDNYLGEPPDHIGIELDFMSYLCRMESKAWENNEITKAKEFLETEKLFLQEHILTWIFLLCEQFKQHGKTEFYKGLAESTESWVTHDNEQIDIIRQYKG